MQAMRYINLLDKVSNVKTRKCFVHNNTIFFAVGKEVMSRAIGPSALHIRKIQDQIGKKVRIIQEEDGLRDIQRFIEDVVAPVRLKSVEVKDGFVTISAGNNQSKAALIGRNRRRFLELRKIMQDVYNLDLKII
jgi:transcription antitermination factor NusA-like protein